MVMDKNQDKKTTYTFKIDQDFLLCCNFYLITTPYLANNLFYNNISNDKIKYNLGVAPKH
jgi:hypothetical protein